VIARREALQVSGGEIVAAANAGAHA